MTMNVTVDLRGSMDEIRHQGSRPTCLAFALSELNRVYQKAPETLSADYLYSSAALAVPGWRPGDGLVLSSGLAAVGTPGQPSERQFPYSSTEPTVPLMLLPQYPPMYKASFIRIAPSVKEIVAFADGGKPLGLVVNLTLTFFDPSKPDGIVTFEDVALPGHRHAILSVGYGIDSTTQEPHVLIRNSWGERWGLNGYGWISQSYIEAHALDAFGA